MMNVQILDTMPNQFIDLFIDGETKRSTISDASCRQVFVFDTFVIKLDGGDGQNAEELNFYLNKLEPEDAQYFPELISYGFDEIYGDFLIFEKIEIHESQTSTLQQRQLLSSLKEKYSIYDVFLKNPNIEGCYFNHNVTPVGENSIKIWDVGCCDEDE